MRDPSPSMLRARQLLAPYTSSADIVAQVASLFDEIELLREERVRQGEERIRQASRLPDPPLIGRPPDQPKESGAKRCHVRCNNVAGCLDDPEPPMKPGMVRAVSWEPVVREPAWLPVLECGHKHTTYDEGDEFTAERKAAAEKEGVYCSTCAQKQRRIAELEKELAALRGPQ